ncbi:MAG: isoleucine--tRNA ligase [Deltaproteobacteria bacterium]|jgi:isoleucyl-tRNA synthetase|nr:isoleucine--tRNA ligase [Deltaproteobacteria bacterium]
MSDYKTSLNLPETSFPMRANLVQREPEIIAFWEKVKAYEAMVAANGHNGQYCLHDGPPYANGHIHLGHALNKVIKDAITKSQNMLGYAARYTPGWDCHGLPIEHKVEQDLTEEKKDLDPLTIRRICREYANGWIDIQREEFKRLGAFGTWDRPYISMDPQYEADTAHALAEFVKKGLVQRSKKAIHWCVNCHTALAEAEVEYEDHASPALHVRFPFTDPDLKKKLPQADPAHAYAVIWTTTPWTLPDNVAITVHPEIDYVLAEVAGPNGTEQYIVAKELLEACAKKFGWEEPKTLAEFKGSILEGLKARHPFYSRDSVFVLDNYVTLDAGTGLVHTAPGHGLEDYETGMRYGLEVLSPMDDAGRFYDEVEFFGGLTVWEANPKIIAKLEEVGHLLYKANIKHSYPHCWRCKKPIIFRATTQWFIMMDDDFKLREKTLKAIREQVKWIPGWGEERIYNMIETRPDWCISRQRNWGVPILALLCENCGEAWQDSDWMHEISDRFATHPRGCDYWFEASLEDVVPAGLTCPKCGKAHWKKEFDILDVWFDSGTSWAAVLDKRPDCLYPASMYLEGSDQHRGWFHSSMLASMGCREIPPYKEVLTHGYVVDGEGKKMSKSVGNVVSPDDIVDKYGAELLRLWISSVDYREDIRYSAEIMSRHVDAYRRIRNTCRFILGNLYDFSKEKAVPFYELEPLDRYALDLVISAHKQICEAFRSYEFHKFYHTLHNLCVTDLSAFYLDVLKDRLYSSAPDSKERRSAQTALHIILTLMMRHMSPILSFTAEEVYQNLPAGLKPAPDTVFAMNEPDLSAFRYSDEDRQNWGILLQVRSEVTRVIEPLRKSGAVGHSLDTVVTLYADEKITAALKALGTELNSLFIVSQLDLKPLAEAPAGAMTADELEGLKLEAAKARGEKCARCWIYSEEIGKDAKHPDVCPRCAAVLEEIEF